eukprot:1183901-Prorocentrum_minimum.AAC.6
MKIKGTGLFASAHHDTCNRTSTLQPTDTARLTVAQCVPAEPERVFCVMTVYVALGTSQCHLCPKLPEQYALIAKRRQLAERVRELQYRVSDQALQQMPDYHMRVKVLQEMGYVDDDKVCAPALACPGLNPYYAMGTISVVCCTPVM